MIVSARLETECQRLSPLVPPGAGSWVPPPIHYPWQMWRFVIVSVKSLKKSLQVIPLLRTLSKVSYPRTQDFEHCSPSLPSLWFLDRSYSPGWPWILTLGYRFVPPCPALPARSSHTACFIAFWWPVLDIYSIDRHFRVSKIPWHAYLTKFGISAGGRKDRLINHLFVVCICIFIISLLVYIVHCVLFVFLRQVLIYCGNPGCLGTRSLDMAGLRSLRSLPLLLLAGVKGGWHCAWLLNLMFLCVINTSSQPEGWEAVILYLLKHNLPSSAMNFVLEYSLWLLSIVL